MSSDPKIFNCPTNSHAGRPGEPDYGMNAYLFSTDPVTGEKTGTPLGIITDPTKVELTTDLKTMTPVGSANGTWPKWKNELKDECTNPFPRSYTVTGYTGVGSGEARHSGGAIQTYVDGHVNMVKGRELGGGKTAFSIPRNGWRVYVDFSQCKDATDALRRMSSYMAMFSDVDDTAAISSGWSFNASTKTLDIASGGSLWMNAINYYKDPDCFGDATGAQDSLMLDCTVDEGGSFGFGEWKSSLGWAFPGTDVDYAQDCDANIFTINTAANFAQCGQLYGYSGYSYAGYTPSTWIAVPPDMAGKRKSIAATSGRWVIEADCMWHSEIIQFPTDHSHPYWTISNDYADIYTWAAQMKARATVEIKGAGADYMSFDGPVLNTQYWVLYNRKLRVSGGTLHVNKILFTSGDASIGMDM